MAIDSQYTHIALIFLLDFHIRLMCLVHFKKLDNCKSLDIGMDKNSQGVPELWWSKFAQYSLDPFYFLNCILFMVKPEGKCTVYSF